MFVCGGGGGGVLPGRSGDKVPIQQPQLAEQNPVDKRHGGQLLQRQMRLELEFLLFREESHAPSPSTRIKRNPGAAKGSLQRLSSVKGKRKGNLASRSQNVPPAAAAAAVFSWAFRGNSPHMIQHRNLQASRTCFVCKREEIVGG